MTVTKKNAILRCVKVFVSYSFKDRKWVAELATKLRAEGFDVWEDSLVEPGANWPLEVGRALNSADAIVLVVSPASAKSDSFIREMEFGLTSKKFRNRLIPVMAKKTDRIPWILKRLNIEVGDPRRISKRIAKRLRESEAA
ncbi:MAG TPA: toll/interleukin-1 receptor domain-containing protein [Candidatus Binataceae bacterium]|nr:toll/interleukin-1 receptor domain-containing protein [Candidatus Binataceae bacterium]